MDDVFRALADPNRRKLLDALFQEDGQTLTALQELLPMTRFGVMKHLQILERAGLITSVKSGRERRHYLNPIPIQQLYDRWVSKYAGTFTGALTRLKHELEDPLTMAATATTTHVYKIHIRTTPERLWQALVDGNDTVRYYYGTRVEGIDTAGGSYSYTGDDGSALITGKVLAADPPRKLVTTFQPHWVPNAAESIVTYEIEPVDDICVLSLRHDRLIEGDALTEGVKNGWAEILSGLKTLIETGQPMSANPGM
jgi:uncharacterized protein YndB with AHSA1/START domain/DNA-binding transcriptional ArsR family regulator